MHGCHNDCITWLMSRLSEPALCACTNIPHRQHELPNQPAVHRWPAQAASRHPPATQSRRLQKCTARSTGRAASRQGLAARMPPSVGRGRCAAAAPGSEAHLQPAARKRRVEQHTAQSPARLASGCFCKRPATTRHAWCLPLCGTAPLCTSQPERGLTLYARANA